jgi:eukaryotic-like serine/threonine-protein kinase
MSAVTSTLDPLAPGTEIIPGYEVLDHLSRARLFDVYDAWSREHMARTVVKVVREDRQDDREARRLLENEARLLSRLSHPHIVRSHGFVREPRPAAILETLGGATLARLIDDSGPLAPAEVAVLGLHLASALQYLHRRRILHLDLKPSNVVAEHGRAVVIDLGLSRPPGRIRPGVGTWCYMAPEQARGGIVGAAADVWAIGVVLFEAATAEPAFDDDEASEDLDASGEPAAYPQLERPAPPLPRSLPEQLRSVIEEALRPEPSRRPRILEVWERLQAVPGVPSLRAVPTRD